MKTSLHILIGLLITISSLADGTALVEEKSVSAAFVASLISMNTAGQVYSAWQILAEQNKDGFAEFQTNVLSNKTTSGKCASLNHWNTIVGSKTTKRLYKNHAQRLQQLYFEFLATTLRYPNTFEIEHLYQRTDHELGLPESVSINLVNNHLSHDWNFLKAATTFTNKTGIGQSEKIKKWYHFTTMNPARYSKESIKANDIDETQARAIFVKSTISNSICMTGAAFNYFKAETQN